MNPKTAPSLQQRAEQFTNNEMERRTQATIFDERGQLKHDAASLAHTGQISMGAYMQLDSIPWAPEPNGSDHAIKLGRLVEYMGTLPGPFGGVVGGPLDRDDQLALNAVATFYMVGQGDMGKGEVRGFPGYAERSAAFADQFLRGEGARATPWGTVEMRETVCRLIVKHNDEREIKLDKRLQVFADAVRYELCRLEPNTAPGMRLLKEHWKPETFHMGWSRDKANARAYMISRGWK
jgi:hypothetical protein